MSRNNYKPNREQGVALLVSLILLLILTVLGVSTMSTASMEMRMAANDQFLENAFQLAETGLDTDLATSVFMVGTLTFLFGVLPIYALMALQV